MTSEFKKALAAFANAIKSEADRGHLEDSSGSIVATADDLLAAIEEEPTTVVSLPSGQIVLGAELAKSEKW